MRGGISFGVALGSAVFNRRGGSGASGRVWCSGCANARPTAHVATVQLEATTCTIAMLEPHCIVIQIQSESSRRKCLGGCIGPGYVKQEP